MSLTLNRIQVMSLAPAERKKWAANVVKQAGIKAALVDLPLAQVTPNCHVQGWNRRVQNLYRSRLRTVAFF